jgi:hypothetical protein
MEICAFKQAACEADAAVRLAAKLLALGNLTSLLMSAPSPPSSDTSSSKGSSLLSYTVRADLAILIRLRPASRAPAPRLPPANFRN